MSGRHDRSGAVWESFYGGRGRSHECPSFLLGNGPGSPSFWGGDLGFVRGSVPESVGGACGITKTDNRTEVSATEGRDMSVCGSREGP